MPDGDVPVRWQVANDEGFDDLVAAGVVTARASSAHTLHVDAKGLDPDTAYYYRFTTAQWASPVGRTRTTPPADARPDRFHFLFASCQNWKDGYFTAWRHAAAEQPDLVVFLGDYIYESGPSPGGVRQHPTDEVTTLAEYRNRYGLYKGDPDLQAAHAAAPWLCTWDDHEVENNYAGTTPQDPADTARFAARRADAYRAWYEHTPTRIKPPDDEGGGSAAVYRTLDWGRLARFFALDTRQYRTDQPCDADLSEDCPERSAPGATILGEEQEAWLLERFEETKATWNVLANQVIMSPVPLGPLFNMDQWDGYPAQRERVVAAMADSELANPVVITGDIHASGLGDLVPKVGADAVGTEIVGTSISSEFPPGLVQAAQDLIGGLDHVKFFDAKSRGYVTCEVTPDALTTRFRVVSTAKERGGDISTASTWVITDGTPGAREA
jgi:alkaline phosphatase D